MTFPRISDQSGLEPPFGTSSEASRAGLSIGQAELDGEPIPRGPAARQSKQ